MEKELLRLAGWVPQSGASRESWHRPCLSDMRGWGRRFSHGVVTSVAAASGGWQGQEQVRPRAAGPWGRMCYLLQTGLHWGSQSPWEEVCPSGWRGAGEEERQKAQSPPLALFVLHSLPQFTLRQCAGNSDTSPPVTRVEQGCSRREEGMWAGAGKAWAHTPREVSFPITETTLQISIKKKFKISLHWFSNMTMLSDAG